MRGSSVKHHFTEAERKEIGRLYKTGGTEGQKYTIAKRFGVSATVINRVLSELGLCDMYKSAGEAYRSEKFELPTPCRCPRCRKDHELSLFWTGSLPARKFCESCRDMADKTLGYTTIGQDVVVGKAI